MDGSCPRPQPLVSVFRAPRSTTEPEIHHRTLEKQTPSSRNGRAVIVPVISHVRLHAHHPFSEKEATMFKALALSPLVLVPVASLSAQDRAIGTTAGPGSHSRAACIASTTSAAAAI